MTLAVNNTLIIISHSARALAESASKAGWDVITVDGFADLDTLKASRLSWCIPLCSGAFVKNILTICLDRINSRFPEARALLGSGAEQYAAWIEKNTQWQICGNSDQVMRRVNDPMQFFQALDQLAIPYPEVTFMQPTVTKAMTWLYKHAHSCGGVGISRGEPDANNMYGYWQKEIRAKALSGLYLSDGKQTQCLGINQLLTCEMTKQHPYVYLGAIANVVVDHKIKGEIISYGENIANHFNLKGVFSVDMIVTGDSQQSAIYILEVNPRISATYELYERINSELNLIDEHIRVCEGKRLSQLTLEHTIFAYQIVYAKQACRVAADIEWPNWSKDLPEQGRLINVGEPLCSVFTQAHDETRVSALLGECEKTIQSILLDN